MNCIILIRNIAGTKNVFSYYFKGNGREEKILIIDKSPSQIMQEVIKIGTTSATR